MDQGGVLTIFGGSAPEPETAAYREASDLGRLAAENGWTIATGGYIGTMEAASRGASQAGGEVLGVTSDRIESWRQVTPNRWITREIRCTNLRQRVTRLIELGDAFIALPGGVGTLSEVALCWSLFQTREISARPLVLVGGRWRRTLEVYQDEGEGYLRKADVALLSFAPDAGSAFQTVLELVRERDGHRGPSEPAESE